MAGGMGQAPIFAIPDDPSLGYGTWAQMSNVHPSNPLVGGSGGLNGGSGGINVTGNERQVAIASPDPTAGAASGAPMSANWREIFNLRGNPIGWVLIASIIYLGLAHISLQGSIKGRAGKSGAGAGAGVHIG